MFAMLMSLFRYGASHFSYYVKINDIQYYNIS